MGTVLHSTLPAWSAYSLSRVSVPFSMGTVLHFYTRKSTDEGLDQDFNSLDAQREAAEAFIRSQRGEGLVALPER
jgi:site-specific DNA recombinase